MVRVAKGRKGKQPGGKKQLQAVNSDEEDDGLYGTFDPKDPFGDDEAEAFHSSRDKVLLSNLNGKASGGKKAKKQYSSDEEEVLAFDGEDDSEADEEEEVEEGSDEEEDDEEVNGEEEDYDLSNSWGRRKSGYYKGNKVENEEDALLEEEEATRLQAKMMKQLDALDFDLGAFRAAETPLTSNAKLAASRAQAAAFGEDASGSEDAPGQMERVAQNLSKMSANEKLDFLQQESPELCELIKEFRSKLDELQETLIPLYNCIKFGMVPHSNASDYLANKMKLYVLYCCHLSFYFMLKSQRLPVDNHPIIKNILQFRTLCKQLNLIDAKLAPEVDYMVDRLKHGTQLRFLKASRAAPKTAKRRFAKKAPVTKDGDVSFDDDDDSEGEAAAGGEGLEADDDSPAAKRAINYQIEKNKGLTPKRSKRQRNPRVANRHKARKALIKRKSIVPKVRTQEKRYSGEASGIRMNVKRSVKFKN